VEPIRIVCPEELAAQWVATVARDGIDVRPTGAHAGIITDHGRESVLEFTADGPGGYEGRLSNATDAGVRQRVQTILLASGATLHLAEAEPVESALYRAAPEILYRLPEGLRVRGMEVHLQPRGAFLGGWLARGRHRIEVNSGPAYDLATHRPAVFVELRPRYRLWLGAELRRLAEDAGAALVEGGAVPVLIFGDRPTERGRR
jgi:hypothetical protein